MNASEALVAVVLSVVMIVELVLRMVFLLALACTILGLILVWDSDEGITGALTPKTYELLKGLSR